MPKITGVLATGCGHNPGGLFLRSSISRNRIGSAVVMAITSGSMKIVLVVEIYSV